MTVSRASRRPALAAALVALGLSLLTAPALAQSGAPVSLVPAPADRQETAPEPAPNQPAGSGFVRAIPGTEDSGVRIRDLGTVGAEAVGLAQEGGDGLTVQMWHGTSRAVAERLLGALPERFASPAAQDLARRLLLVAAEPPGGGGADLGLVKLRVERLIALGAAEDAERLLSAVSARAVPKALIEPAIEARLLAFDFDGACRAVDSMDSGVTTEFGQKALIFCQLLKQQFSQAVLGLDLLRELNLAQDQTFFELANAVIAGAPPTGKQFATPGRASALNLALFHVAGGSVPAWFTDTQSPSLLRTIAITGEADRETRLAAARGAAQWGALTPQELADIYAALAISADEATAVLLAPDTASPGLRLAALDRAAKAQTIAVAQAEALRDVWHVAAQQGDWRLVARLTEAQLRQIEPSAAFSWFADPAIAANLAAGQVDRALAWSDIAAAAGVNDPAAAQAFTALWPALRIAAGGNAAASDGPQARVFDQSGLRTVSSLPTVVGASAADRDRFPWDERRLAEWIALAKGPGEGGAAKVATVLALFDALGEQISDAAWVGAEGAEPAATALPPLDAWVGVQRAAREGKTAETALYALLAIGDGEVARLHPAALHSVVGALRQAGLIRSARALALEVALTATP